MPGLMTETISVPDIHCDNCKASIEGALAQLDGVIAAQVDVPARTVTVEYDNGRLAHPDVVRAIVDQGYDVPE